MSGLSCLSGGRRRRSSLALASAPLLLLAACTAGNGPTITAKGTQGATQPTTAVAAGSGHHATPPARPQPDGFIFSPPDGARGVAPGQGITVWATAGSLQSVTVHTAGDAVTGTLGSGRRVWHSEWALDVTQSYTVTATERVDGRDVTATSRFTTLVPAQTFTTLIYEGYQLTYGVGMPIELEFDHPITNKAAVERSLQITTSKPVVGAWYWNGDEQVDFRPRTYWPGNTEVSFVGHLNGVEGPPGVYGDHTLTQSFRIGPSLIVVAGTQTHYMDVWYGGRHLYHWPISAGRPTLPTPDGTYLTIDKANPQLMVGPGYRLEVPWSVRFTMSGDFLHDAYWSVSVQGSANVSHGCVNMPPADAEIYYNMAVPGDPVTITGSSAAGTFNDGFTEWFLTWSQVVAGSALHEVVVAGPTGSKFLPPAAIPGVQATAPLETSPPDNYLAA